MRSICFFALVLVLLSGPALSQEPAVTQARHPVWLEPCPEADSSDVEVLKARVDCLERRSEAMADSQNLLLQNMFLLLEEQFLNEPVKIVERIPAVAHEAELLTAVSSMAEVSPARTSHRHMRSNDRFFQVTGRSKPDIFSRASEVVFSRFFTYQHAVPTVVNCVPPLMEKSGFVLIGAKLSYWTNRQVSGEVAISECIGTNPGLTLNY